MAACSARRRSDEKGDSRALLNRGTRSAESAVLRRAARAAFVVSRMGFVVYRSRCKRAGVIREQSARNARRGRTTPGADVGIHS
jgi:hypothetical protein